MDMTQDDQHFRRAVRWPARYRPELDSTWTPCRVIDVSLDGAALALPAGAVAPTGVVIVEVLLTDYRARISLRAEVRNQHLTSEGLERVGVKFDSPTFVERSILEELVSGTLPNRDAPEHPSNARRD